VSVTQDALERINLTRDEYDLICQHIGREPDGLELQIFAVMWSEHCSYKSSRVYLRRLPAHGERVLQRPGENVGIVDIGDELAVVFKIESHNHPSFIDPYQGAATGVGGIIRSIFTMGARPIAILDSLRLGPLSDPRNRGRLRGIVSGIAGYGNCTGIPTAGGEVRFDECYSANPIVNVLGVGVVRQGEICCARAHGIGNPVIYAGAKTGRDRIDGTTMASAELNDDAREKRPNVQVGDPFMEKLLLEACLEINKAGLIVGMQGMGAGGLTCSSAEMGARAGTGIDLDISCVPLREEGMTPDEIMLSESQERMLLVTERCREREVETILRKWGIDSSVVGTVFADPVLRVRRGEEVLAEIPNRYLTDDAPAYERPARLPEPAETPLPPLPRADPADALLQLLAAPSIASKRWICEQYDHLVRTNPMVLPGSDATVLRIEGTSKGIALSVDGNGWACAAHPLRGAQAVVAEAARNVACSGARPIAATNCLNFGNPERPEIMGQFSDVIDGMASACRALQVPITGGNVSFYNETSGASIQPTPVVGVLGLLEDVSAVVTHDFKADGDIIYLAGGGRPALGASEFLRTVHGLRTGLPAEIDLVLEKTLHEFCIQAATSRLLASAHDCSDGGLLVAIAESGFDRIIGATIDLDAAAMDGGTFEELAFGEGGGRVVVSVSESNAGSLESLASTLGCPLKRLGRAGGKALQLTWRGEQVFDLSMERMKATWANALEQRLSMSVP